VDEHTQAAGQVSVKNRSVIGLKHFPLLPFRGDRAVYVTLR
jgi:hypothetical protein